MKSPRIISVCVLLVAVVLSRCSSIDQTPAMEPIISVEEQPAMQGSDGDIVAFLSEYVEKLARKENFSGVVLFARDETVLFYRAYGLASRRYNVPNDTGTRFNLASASKMFTAVAIARLVEGGQLAFDDPVGKYLDADWVSREVGEKVRISHLLTHTSGLGHYWDEWEKYALTIRTLDDFKPLISDELAFEPGAEWQYSNSGYLLLGVIVEEVTGRTYYDYVQEEIFDPCAMADTGFFEMDEPHHNLATGYYEDEEDGSKLKNNTLMHGIRGGSAGGGWSTPADLLRFLIALRSDELVSSGMRDILWTPKPASPDYGYGFQIRDNWIGHWGGFPGIEAFVFYFPDSGHTFVVLSNYYDSALPLIDKMDKWFKRLDRVGAVSGRGPG